MKTDFLMDVFNEIDPTYIEEAAYEVDDSAFRSVRLRRKRRRRHIYTCVTTAAACVLIAMVVYQYSMQYVRIGADSVTEGIMEEMQTEGVPEITTEEACGGVLENCPPDQIVWQEDQKFLSQMEQWIERAETEEEENGIAVYTLTHRPDIGDCQASIINGQEIYLFEDADNQILVAYYEREEEYYLVIAKDMDRDEFVEEVSAQSMRLLP